MAWTNPRTWVAAEVVTAALLNTHVRDNLKAVGDVWTGYTPVWTGATGNPAIGNGSLIGDYMAGGKLIAFRAVITMGSTTTYGTGQWRLTLPVAPVATLWSFSCELRDTGAAAYTGRAVWRLGSEVEIFTGATTAGAADRGVAAAVPFTWGTGDTLTVNGVYQAA